MLDAKNAIVISLSEGSETVPRPTDCRDRHFPSASDALKRSRRVQTGGYLIRDVYAPRSRHGRAVDSRDPARRSYGRCDANCRDFVFSLPWHTLPSRNRGGSSFAARVDFGVTIELANFVRVYPEVPRLVDDVDRAALQHAGARQIRGHRAHRSWQRIWLASNRSHRSR